MTKYHPIYEVNKIIKGYAVKYNKSVCKVHSLWYFEDDITLVICSDCPGVWIGRAGIGIEKLKDEINAMIDHRNQVLNNAYSAGRIKFLPIRVKRIETIKFIDCNF